MLINFGKFELKPEDGDQESKDGQGDERSEKDDDYNKDSGKQQYQFKT